jgi:hypothetical protein
LRFNLVFHTPSNYWAWRGLRWGKDDLCERERARWVGINAQAFPVQGPRFYSYSSGFSSALDKANPDLWHLHSLWIYPGVAMERWSRLACKPYMVTPNGMLEPWALSNSGWKKTGGIFFMRMRHENIQPQSSARAGVRKSNRRLARRVRDWERPNQMTRMRTDYTEA